MGSALQIGQLDGCAGLYSLPLGIVKVIFHLTLNLVSCRIAQMEGKGLLFLLQHLFRQVAGQHLLTGAQRHAGASCMALACLVGNVRFHHKVIEHRALRVNTVRQLQGHIDAEPSVRVRHQLARLDGGVIVSVTYVALIPVTAVAQPPVGHAALHRVFHRSALDAHAGIRAGLTLYGQRVACLVGLRHVVEQHLVCRPLVFLYAEILSRATRLNAVTASQSACGQHKLCRSLTVLVCRYRLLLNHLVVGVTQT